MILFKKVRYKNFLSTGQQFIEIDLDKANTTLVVGENGAGKSTMLDALCFGLFQRPFRGIKKDQLINSINEKECIVEVYRVEIVFKFVHYTSLPHASQPSNVCLANNSILGRSPHNSIISFLILSGFLLCSLR